MLREVIEALDALPLHIPVTFSIVPGASTDLYSGYLRVEYRTTDAYFPDRQIDQIFQMHIPYVAPTSFYGMPEPTPLQWARWLLWVISFIAVHEVAEFFVVGGRRLFDPHNVNTPSVLSLPPPPCEL